jgi:hypothetical protein
MLKMYHHFSTLGFDSEKMDEKNHLDQNPNRSNYFDFFGSMVNTPTPRELFSR